MSSREYSIVQRGEGIYLGGVEVAVVKEEHRESGATREASGSWRGGCWGVVGRFHRRCCRCIEMPARELWTSSVLGHPLLPLPSLLREGVGGRDEIQEMCITSDVCGDTLLFEVVYRSVYECLASWRSSQRQVDLNIRRQGFIMSQCYLKLSARESALAS